MANLKIGFYKRNHSDNYPFDGRGKVLAHTFYPKIGQIHFDDDEVWSNGTTGIYFYGVAVHEFGHSVGLLHSNLEGSVMSPYYVGYKPNITLSPDDINGIKAICGSI
ncbi:hypothetical protein HELRODRAFT_169273 [Helobdella robusta]|uniref:Peptidase metallopeptidase domain-containing protein n=1 Tax=Helobdella robusta TaxID=6412 RepID=T1F1P4_HELRO|nr:hypothetical protein HELRODRAFT_169273 [Helobdella robusta]ESO08431.1 hypothetical protein HELRODRAFT_169273 [Helobdella robusta]